ncbi:MAG: hypothetical protein JSU73_13330, partial [candidate division WOR-3 bacterium]
MRSPSIVALVLILGLMAAANFGCMKCGEGMAEKAVERGLEAAIEKGSGGKADVDVGESVDLSELPDIMKYPGAKAVGKWSMSTEDGTGTNFMLETGDARQKVKDWYLSSMTGAGYKKAMEMDTRDGLVMIFSKEGDDKTAATVTIATEDGKTTVGVL